MAASQDQCRNCGSGLTPQQRYCGGCGQKRGVERLTIVQLGHDFLHVLTHVDRGLFALLWPVLVRPGRVARDFIEGKRKRYFSPLAWLVIISGLFSAEVAVTGLYVFTPSYRTKFVDLLEHHVNVAFLIQVPVLAFYCRLLFRHGRFNIAEYLVLAAYTAGVRMLFFGLLLFPVVLLLRPGQTTVLYAISASALLWSLYFGFAAAQLDAGEGSRPVSWLKGSLAALLATITTSAALSAVATLWVLVWG
jgi:Protein of unknown function (DUF3667)